MRLLRTIFIFTLCPLLLASCQELREAGIRLESPHAVKEQPRNGPPPHAPAHGYRYKNPQGVDLRFDSDLGVYIVVDVPDVYFQDGLYMRWGGDRWQTSRDLHGPWQADMHGNVPTKLKEKHGRGHEKWKGEGKRKKR
ncbi:MAG TPA: hypothetical protein VNI58_09160 [Mariprofundaceae bacterium]|nr:hypothetical protein [Mariprofundaceae bacterium]